MRSVGFLALLVGVLVCTALASPWVTWALPLVVTHRFTFNRVYNRVFEVLLAVALALAWRRLDLGTAASLGLRRRDWAAQLRRGLGIGLAGIAAALALSALCGALAPALRYPPLKTVRKAALGALGSLVIGVGEETVFRGVVLGRLRRDFGIVIAVLVTTAAYAAVHEIGKSGSPPTVDAWSGVARTAALFAPIGTPAARPQLVGLFLFGLVLAAARLRSGSLWLPIGIHAAWVAVFRIGRLGFEIAGPGWLVGTGWPPLVGGAAGALAVVVSALLLMRR